MLTRYKIENGSVQESTDPSAGVLVCISPEENEKAMLKEQFALDDYDMASALDVDEIPRLESVGDRIFIIWKIPERSQIGKMIDLGVQTIGIAIRQGRIAIIMSRGEVSFATREYKGVNSSTAFLFGFLLHGVRHYVGHLRAIKIMSGDIEKRLTVSLENHYLLQMFNLSESLVYYIDSLEGDNIVLAKLRAMAPSLGADPTMISSLDDIILEGSQAARQANIYSTVLSGLMDARGSIINNNMNVLLTNLTTINIIFLPLNLIASIGGMSEWTMMTSGVDWRISYTFFIVAMVGLGWLTWFFVRRVILEKIGGERRHRKHRHRLDYHS